MSIVPPEVWSLPSLKHFQAQGNPYLQTPPSEYSIEDIGDAQGSVARSTSSSRKSRQSKDRKSSHGEYISKEERFLNEKANLSLKSEAIGFVADEWIPSPFQTLDMPGCSLQGLPLALVAGAHTAFISHANFEHKRMEEIMKESDSSSEEEEEVKPRRRPNSSTVTSESSTDGSTVNSTEGAPIIKVKKKLNARQLLKIEKKAAKKERRARVAPLIGIENTTELNLSDNQLPYFPCVINSAKGGVLLKEEASLMSCRFKSLTTLNLARNRLTGIDPLLFTHSASLTSINLSFNQLQSISSELCESNTRLTSLMLDHNRITHFPDNIGNLVLLNKLTASFNLLTVLPQSISSLSSLQTIDLASNFELEPPQLMQAVQIGRRAVIRQLLGLPDSFSLSNKAEKFCPKQSLTVRRLAGGVIAEDEAMIRDENQSDSGSEEEEVPPKIMKPPSSEILVYDHQGDTLDHATKESYLCKGYSLHYQVERVLPPKHVRKADPDSDTLTTASAMS